MENNNPKEAEALCKECGHGFKAYMDRVLAAGQGPRNSKDTAKSANSAEYGP